MTVVITPCPLPQVLSPQLSNSFSGEVFSMSDLSPSILQTRLADLVQADPRITPVLDRFGLDYCCRGYRTLQEASIDQAVPVSEVLDELEAIGPRPADADAAAVWTDLPGLIRHIVSRHHRYVREHQPVLQALLDKLVKRHGAGHPELFEVRAVFDSLSEEMLQHMSKEENILFPFIETLAATSAGQPRPVSPFGTILNPIRAMEQEHLEAGDLLARLRTLTGGYQPPEDACMSYRLCFEGLAQFESDLHQHVYLENYVLFPRAIAMEGALG
jgi:regulator of cell morphogenesis and NO signaling